MSRADSIYRQIKVSINNISFKDLCYLVEKVGFIWRRTSGDHRIYKHPYIKKIINLQPDKNKAKPYQVQQVLDIVEEHELL